MCIDPSPPNGSGGFYPNPTYLTIPEVTVGTPVSLTVTAIQPGAEGSTGTFTLSYPTADLAFTGTSSDGTCGSVTTATDPDDSTVSCTFGDLDNSDTSKPFNFATLTADETAVNASVTVGSATATAWFGLDVTTPSCDPNAALCIDPSPPNGSGGFYPNPTYLTVPEVTVGTPVSLTVTAIQPGAEGSTGTFTLSYPTADLAFTGTSSDGTCGSVTTATDPDDSTVSCTFGDLDNSDTSKPFNFATLTADETAVNASVTVGSATATAWFGLDVTS